MNLKKGLLAMALLVFGVIALNAQKFGHINTSALLVEMSEVKDADKQLNDYQTTLMTKGEEMVKAFEANYTKYAADAQSGTLSQIEIQQLQSSLGAEQQAIQQYEQEVQQKLLDRKAELYKPIFEKVRKVINEVGTEGAYTMIFDTSTGALLHVDTGQDISAAVKAKLGI